MFFNADNYYVILKTNIIFSEDNSTQLPANSALLLNKLVLEIVYDVQDVPEDGASEELFMGIIDADAEVQPAELVSDPVEVIMESDVNMETVYVVAPRFAPEIAELFSNGWDDAIFSAELAAFFIKKIEGRDHAQFHREWSTADDGATFNNFLPMTMITAVIPDARADYAVPDTDSSSKIDSNHQVESDASERDYLSVGIAQQMFVPTDTYPCAQEYFLQENPR